MSQAWLDLGFDICLYFGPFLRFNGWVFRDLGTKIAGFNGRKDASVGEGIEMIYDYLLQESSQSRFEYFESMCVVEKPEVCEGHPWSARGDTDCHQWLHEPQRGTVLDPLVGSLRISDEYVYEYDS